jgi:hypothetical protein
LRALFFIPIAPIFAVGAVAFASCDTGGEPPELDSGDEAIPFDGTPDTPAMTDSPTGDGGTDATDGACGLVGNACCKGDGSVACQSPAVCDVAGGNVCEMKGCGGLGHSCCVGLTSKPCDEGASCSDGGTCIACGTPGDSCCALNTCNSGGCCVSDTCRQEGDNCGNDGGVCSAGGCGTCGSKGQPCCTTGCTAPGTYCKGAVAPEDAGEGGGSSGGSSGECVSCGGPGERCCTGSACSGSLTCVSSFCTCASSGSCEDAATGG